MSMDPEDRYRHDQVFRQMVDMMELQIRAANYTPTELRQAAILAAIHFERTNLRRYAIVPRDEVERLSDLDHAMRERWGQQNGEQR